MWIIVGYVLCAVARTTGFGSYTRLQGTRFVVIAQVCSCNTGTVCK